MPVITTRGASPAGSLSASSSGMAAAVIPSLSSTSASIDPDQIVAFNDEHVHGRLTGQRTPMMRSIT
jgi:hypothetical protein